MALEVDKAGVKRQTDFFFLENHAGGSSHSKMGSMRIEKEKQI